MGTGRPRKGTLEPLLDGSLLSAYWMGFLLADGYVSDQRKVLGVTLGSVDAAHLSRLAAYLCGPTVRYHRGSCRIEICHPDAFDKLKEKFGSMHQKTKLPPDVSKMAISEDEQFSMIVGYIDGDGHIAKRVGSGARIKGHIAWLENYSYWYEFWYRYLDVIHSGSVRTNSRGYSVMDLNSVSMFRAKNKALDFNLPLLERKWNSALEQKRYKLNADQVGEIRRSELSTASLSVAYKVCEGTIQGIRAGRIWKRYLPCPTPTFS